MANTFWDERYASEQLVYGSAPNEFVAQMAQHFPARGQALDIAAGEGRNALFMASLGLDVLAIDQSEVGLAKAQRLARERGVALRTTVTDLAEFDAAPETFDVITSTFVHLPQSL